MVGSTIGPYLIVEKLGAGGMGEVYLAFDTRLNRKVAVKVLADSSLDAPDRKDRLLREARAAAGLSHPNIAAIHDIVETGPPPCIVMEFVQGENLAARVRRGPIPCAEAVSIGIQLADALAHAHAAGVVHRDLKPANVVLASDGVAKILDFGLATSPEVDSANKSPEDVTREVVESQAGRVSGTPAYMAPEQLMGRAATPQSDIYSLGVLLFELLTGKRPYHGPDLVGLALAVVSEPTPTAEAADPSVPLDVSAAVARAMAKEPGERYRSAGEFAADLRRAGRALSEGVTFDAHRSSANVTSPERRPSWMRLARARVLLVALAAFAIVIAAGVAYWRGHTASRPEMTLGQSVQPIVGVLPLANLTGDASKDDVGWSISEALTSSLSTIPTVTAISADDTRKQRSVAQDVPKIARNLGATFLVTGTVAEAGPRLVFTASLSQSDGAVIWNRRYEGARTGQNKLQEQLADDVAAALKLDLTPQQHQEVARVTAVNVFANADYTRGLVLLERSDVRGSIDQAIGAFKAAIAKEPGFARAHAGLGDAEFAAYNRTKDPKAAARAIESIKRAIDLDPADPKIHVSLANVYYRTGKLEQAEAELQAAIRKNPNDEQAYRLLGRVLGRLGRAEDAIRAYSEAIKIRPQYAPNYSALGAYYWNNSRYEEAAMQFAEVVQLQPDNVDGLLNLGAAYAASGDDERALRNLRAAANLGDGRAWSNIGTIEYYKGRYAEAAEAAKKAVDLEQQNATSHRNLGDIYQQLGRLADARKEYRRATELAERDLAVNPRDAITLTELALNEVKMGKTAEALRHAAEAVKSTPADNVVLFHCAAVHALANRPDDAAQWLQRAIEKGYSRKWAGQDPDLASIRTLPKVAAILGNTR